MWIKITANRLSFNRFTWQNKSMETGKVLIKRGIAHFTLVNPEILII